MIAIVDYGMGNLGSVANMFRRIGAPATISSSPHALEQATKIVLPGVGAFDAGMQSLEERGLRAILERKALKERVPVLGICLGAQLLTSGSEEGLRSGLGWIPARTRRFPAGADLRVPHMGWNAIRVRQASALARAADTDLRFYFVHSYYICVERDEHSLFKTTYGLEFDSGIRHENIYGVQFHPEKSHRFGMELLANFARLPVAC